MANTPKVPSEIEAEAALLGCIFLDPELIFQVSDIVSADDFYDSKNKILYRVMLDLSREGKAIDATTVIGRLNMLGLIDQSGGTEHLVQIANSGYSTVNVETYIDLILNASIRRNAISTLGNLAQKGYDNTTSSEDYIDLIEKQVFDLSKNRRVEQFKRISIVAKNVLNNTENNAKRTGEVIGLDTGFTSLNIKTQGFQNGALLILAARPAMGKSAMAMNLAVNVATKNNGGLARVAIFSLEMSAEQLVERMIAADSSIKLGQIKSGHIPNSDWVRFTTSCSKLSQMNLFFDDSSAITVSSIRAKCRKLKAEEGLDFVVIDYLQLIEGDSSTRNASQMEKVSKITRSLKLMARELEIPVLALSQLSRDVEKRDEKKPVMSDLRDSGTIEQDADIVMFLYRDDYYNPGSERKGEADLIIAKNRSGQTSEGLPFIFTGEYQRFKEKKEEA